MSGWMGAAAPVAAIVRAVVVPRAQASLAAGLLRAARWGTPGGAGLVVQPVASREDAREAVAAALGGAAVVAVDDDPEATDLAIDDLRRIASVDDRRRSGPTHPVDALTGVQLQLLAAIAEGASIAAAAAAAHVSVRTAHRRLGEGAEALGASSTAAALSQVAARLRELGPDAPTPTVVGLVGRDGAVGEIVGELAAGRCVAVTGGRGVGTSAVLRAAASQVGATDRVVPGLALLDGTAMFDRLAGGRGAAEAPAAFAARIARADPRPVFVDDAHLLGPEGREVVAGLATRLPLALGGVAASDPLLAAIGPARSATTIELDPLSPGDAEHLVRQLGPAAGARVAEVVALGRGYPSRLVAIAAAPADGMGTVADEALRQVRVDRGVAEVGAMVAMAAGPLPVAALPPAALDALEASGLTRRTDGTVSPAGPVTRRVLASLAADDRLTELHRRIADLVGDPVAAAEHRLAAGDHAAAFGLATTALLPGMATTQRARALVVAVRSAEEDEVALDLLDAAIRAVLAAQSLGAARALIAEVVAARPSLGSAPRIVVLDAGLRVHAGLGDSATELLDAALAAADLDRSDEVRLRTIKLGVRLASGRDIDGLRREAGELGPVLAEEAPDLTSQMMPGIAMAMQGDPGWPDHLLPLHASALGSVDAAPGSSDLLFALGSEVVAFFLGAYGDLPASVDLLDRSIVALESIGAHALARDLGVMRAYTSIAVDGPTDDGIERLRDAIPHASSSRQRSAGCATLAMSEAERGRLGEAAAALALGRLGESDPIGDEVLRFADATVAWWAGDSAQALAIAERDPLDAASFSVLPMQMWALAAIARLDLGLAPEPIPAPISYPGFAWVPDQIDAVRSLLAGDAAAAVAHAHRALSHPGTAARDVLVLRWLLGEALVRAGDHDRACELLARLEVHAVGQGLAPLARRTRASLRRAGQPTPPKRTPDAGRLSARELEVLGLVGEGLTSKQIAARLHLAPSSVDTTIKRAMAKLGARTRIEAAIAISIER